MAKGKAKTKKKAKRKPKPKNPLKLTKDQIIGIRAAVAVAVAGTCYQAKEYVDKFLAVIDYDSSGIKIPARVGLLVIRNYDGHMYAVTEVKGDKLTLFRRDNVANATVRTVTDASGFALVAPKK